MKRHLLFLLLLFGIATANSQSVELLDDKRISIKNNDKDYLNFILLNKRTGEIIDSMHLHPGRSFELRLPGKLNRRSVHKYEIVSVYDHSSYYNRLRLIGNEFKRREAERQRSALAEALLRGFDQWATGGVFSMIYDGVGLVNDAFNGKSVEELGADIVSNALESKFIDEIDGKAAQGMAAFAISMIKAAQEADYPDLRQAAETALQMVSSPKSQKTYPLNERVKFYVRDEVFVHAAYPVHSKFSFKESEDLKTSAFGEGPYPFDLQLNYWRRDKDAGYFPSLSVMRTPILYSTTADTVFTPGNAVQYLNASLGLGIVARYSGLTLRLGGYVGMLSETTYTYQLDGGTILNLNAGQTEYFKTFNFNYRGGLTYDFGRIKLNADYAGLLPHNKVKVGNGDEVRLMKGSFISAGVSVALLRRWRGYGM